MQRFLRRQKVHQQNLTYLKRIRTEVKYSQNLSNFRTKPIYHAASIWLSMKAKRIQREFALFNMNYIPSEIRSKSESFLHKAHLSCFIDLAIRKGKWIYTELGSLNMNWILSKNMVKIWHLFGWHHFPCYSNKQCSPSLEGKNCMNKTWII